MAYGLSFPQAIREPMLHTSLYAAAWKPWRSQKHEASGIDARRRNRERPIARFRRGDEGRLHAEYRAERGEAANQELANARRHAEGAEHDFVIPEFRAAP